MNNDIIIDHLREILEKLEEEYKDVTWESEEYDWIERIEALEKAIDILKGLENLKGFLK